MGICLCGMCLLDVARILPIAAHLGSIAILTENF
jgi:hypothetical protein